MAKFDEWNMTGATVEDKKALIAHLDDEIELTIDNQGKVWTEGGQYIADAVEALEDGIGIAMQNRPVTPKTVTSLQELTHQESGLVIYKDGIGILCNWSSMDGLPRLFATGLIDFPAEIPAVEGRHVDDFAILVEDVEIDNHSSDNPDLTGPATVYEFKVGDDEITVIAPEEWA